MNGRNIFTAGLVLILVLVALAYAGDMFTAHASSCRI